MLILKHNSLSEQELLNIEQALIRWSDNNGPRITPELNVLDLSRTDVLGLLLAIFQRLGILETLATCHSSLLDFFVDVYAAYVDAPYHSFYHAADVVIMLYYLLTDLGALVHLSALDTTSLLLATLCHDVGHPGYNNTYQVGFKTDLAAQYKNISVLESYSIDITRRLLTKHDLLKHVSAQSTPPLSPPLSPSPSPSTSTSTSTSIFQSKSKQVSMVERIERLILSTDMVYHEQLQQQTSWLKSAMTKTNQNSKPKPKPKTINTNSNSNSLEITMMDRDDRQGLCRVLLHAADISNTVRPWPIAKQWSDLIVQEFFRQGDAERRAGLPVSPGMDRDLSSQADISLGFGDFVVKPYFEAIAGLLPAATVLVDTLKSNRRQWDNLKMKIKTTTTTTMTTTATTMDTESFESLEECLVCNSTSIDTDEKVLLPPSPLSPVSTSPLSPSLSPQHLPQSPLSKNLVLPVTPPDDPTFAMRIETWCHHKTQKLQLHLQQQRHQ
ncbi:hypothetical protein J3Q64DRAFT_1385696 [Phycomyces blakesleeanus]|uniref:Phosphodiesterase n=1 Tax=Phycomyces blakesleeanus TaxID=4837 RepID=A0ABR3AJF9_PHYBL